MRIVLVSHVARPSGAEIVLERLAAEMASAHDVHAVFFEDGIIAQRLRDRNVSVHVLDVAKALVDARRERVRLPGLAGVRALRDMRRLLRSIEPDVVHAHSLKAGLVAGAAARSTKVPFVWHVHDRITAEYLPRTTVALVRAALRLLPDAVAANSAATLATFRSRGPRAVIPNPVPPPPEGFLPRDGRTGPPLVFGLVGRITRWKGQDVFVRAFARAFPSGPQRAVLVGDVMFGEAAFGAELQQLIAESGVADRIEFRGFREDVWTELARLDVLVHASRIPEPFGLVIVEGALAGLPVIASDAGGPREILSDVAGTMLVAPGDINALSSALIAFAPGEIPEPDRAVLAHRFSPHAAARETRALYDRVVS